MAELEDMINSVLSDPAQMSKIADLAQNLMGGSKAAPETQATFSPFDPGMMSKLQTMLNNTGSSPGSSEALLRAMQPYLSEKRRLKVDKALRIARMAKLAGFAMEELGGDNK